MANVISITAAMPPVPVAAVCMAKKIAASVKAHASMHKIFLCSIVMQAPAAKIFYRHGKSSKSKSRYGGIRNASARAKSVLREIA